MDTLLQVTGCSSELQRPRCHTDCLSERYRSITGECNNRSVPSQKNTVMGCFFFFKYPESLCACVAVLIRQYPRWGAANIQYSRWLPPEYEDVWGTPRGWDPEHAYHNFTLPPVSCPLHPWLSHAPVSGNTSTGSNRVCPAGAAGVPGGSVHPQRQHLSGLHSVPSAGGVGPVDRP